MSNSLKLATKTSNEVTLKKIGEDKYFIDLLFLTRYGFNGITDIENISFTYRDTAYYSNVTNILYIPIDMADENAGGIIFILKENIPKINKIIEEINKKYHIINLEDTNETTISTRKNLPRITFGGAYGFTSN